MIIYPLGLFLAFGFLSLAAFHLGQNVGTYYDFVALTMVLGGSFALAVIILPWEHRKELMRAFKILFIPEAVHTKENLRLCMQAIQTKKPSVFSSALLNDIIGDGLEMLELGMKQESIESILKERIYQKTKQLKKISMSLRSLAKYPPALGLMGTVIGLVSLMRGISNGLSAQETGLEMSVALIATFYGLIVSNFFINPAGEALLKKSQEEEQWGEIGLQTILLISEQASLLESQEMLNSYVSKEDRINILSNIIEEDTIAEEHSAA